MKSVSLILCCAIYLALKNLLVGEPVEIEQILMVAIVSSAVCLLIERAKEWRS